jgi:hypothetical protein
MTERRCENCRWWSAGPTGYGYCHRRPPIVSNSDESFPSTHKSVWCGEWADASITPEQEDRQKLTRQFAVAIMSTQYGGDLRPDRVWSAAKLLAAAEPQIQREDGK